MLEKIKAEIREQLLATSAAGKAGDVDTFLQHFHSESSGFQPNSGLLEKGLNRDALQAAFDAGKRSDLQFQQLDVKLCGENTAVATAYVVGKLHAFGEGRWRFSEVLTKQNGQWQSVHFHISPLEVPVP